MLEVLRAKTSAARQYRPGTDLGQGRKVHTTATGCVRSRGDRARETFSADLILSAHPASMMGGREESAKYAHNTETSNGLVLSVEPHGCCAQWDNQPSQSLIKITYPVVS